MKTMLSGVTRALLLVDGSRRTLEGNVALVIPPVAGILNLLACASFEPSLETDATGHTLSLFFLLQTTLFIALTITHFSGQSLPVLTRSRIFPGTPADRFLFVVIVNLRRRIVLALLLSTLFFLAVVYRHTPLTAVAAIFLYGLLLCASEALLATIMLALARTPYPAASGLALGGVLCVGCSAGLLSPDPGGFLAVLPPVNWAAGGVVAAAGGTVFGFFLNSTLIAATGALAAIIGSRTA